MTDRVITPGVAPSSPLPNPSPRAERRLVVAALAAELGHDLQAPLNLFRHSVDRLALGDTLDAEDLGLLVEELEQMRLLGARLRELARVSGPRVACSPRQLVQLALAGMGPLPPDLEIDAPDSVTLVCDAALLGQALRELIHNALAAKTTRAGVRFETGDAPGFCVWDDGEGLTIRSEAALAWGVTTQPFAAGLGLTLALRAVRAHGFDLTLRRVPPRTEALISIPATQLTRGVAT